MTSQQFTPYGAPVDEARWLPAQPPGQIVGRNRELAAMHQALKAGRAILLQGPAGIGKTALAAVLSAAHLASKQGSVLWLHMAEDDLRCLVMRVGRAFGIDTLAAGTFDLPDRIAEVRALLAKKAPLIVLDGLVDADETREFVAQVAPGLPVIVTHDAAIPGDWTPFALAPLSEADRITLFQQYSGLRDDRFKADIAGLCKFLEGIPLTVELAARYTAAEKLTPGELVAKLPTNTGLDSQGTILALALKALKPAVQGVLKVMASIFSGGAGMELIGDLTGIPVGSVLPAMRALSVRGLVRESNREGQPYFIVHESVQRHELASLRAYGRLEALENRFLEAVAAYATRHAQDTPAHHAALALEMENLMNVAAVATERGNLPLVEALIEALGTKAGSFVAARGFRSELEQLRMLRTLLQPTQPASVPELQPVPAPPPLPEIAATPHHDTRPLSLAEPPVEDTQATPNLGLIDDKYRTRTAMDTQPLPVVPDFPDAPPKDVPEDILGSDVDNLDFVPGETTSSYVPAHAEVLPDAAAVQAAHEATLFDSSPTVSMFREPPTVPEDTEQPTETSLPTLEAMLADARRENDPGRTGAILHTLGRYYLEHEDSGTARRCFEEALTHYEAARDSEGIAAALESLAGVAVGGPDAADFARRAIDAARSIADPAREGRLYLLLADARAADGQDAVEAYTRAVEKLRATEDWALIGQGMARLGKAFRKADKPAEAAMMLEQAAVIFHREGLLNDETDALIGIGESWEALRQWERAQSYFERALFLAHERFDRRDEAICLGALAHVRYMQADRPEAVRRYRQALHIAYEIGDGPLQAIYARELARQLIDNLPYLSQAAALLREAVAASPDDDDAARLLKRAQERLKRVSSAGLKADPASESNREFAAQAYVV